MQFNYNANADKIRRNAVSNITQAEKNTSFQNCKHVPKSNLRFVCPMLLTTPALFCLSAHRQTSLSFEKVLQYLEDRESERWPVSPT